MLIFQVNVVLTLIQNVMIRCRPLQNYNVTTGMKFKILIAIILIEMTERDTSYKLCFHFCGRIYIIESMVIPSCLFNTFFYFFNIKYRFWLMIMYNSGSFIMMSVP